LTASDVTHTIRVQETATNAGGTGGPATSSQTGVVTPPAPVNSSPPTISGTAQQGQVLSESHGTWTNSPTSYAYQWEDCDSSGNSCTAISGATSQTYTLTASDVTHTIRVQETATNAGGTGGPISSSQTGVVTPPAPVNSSPPTISGTAQQGQTLTLAQGVWSHNPTSINDRWQDCDAAGNNCSNTGVSAPSYVLTSNDVGHTIRVQETASNAGGLGNPAQSSATAVVTAPPAQVSATAQPASGVQSTSAVVNGLVNTGGAAVSWKFDYGPTKSYGSSTPSTSIAAGASSPQSVSSKLAKLGPGTSYHFRLVVTYTNNGSSTDVDSNDLAFTTTAAGKLVLGAKTLKVAHKSVAIPLSCQSQLPCVSSFTIAVAAKSKNKKAVVCVSKVAKLGAGRKKTVKAKVSGACRKLLRKTHHRRMKVNFTAKPQTGQAGLTTRVKLRL
jgi:hypothetical protein